MTYMLVSNSGYLKIVQKDQTTFMWKVRTHAVMGPRISDQPHHRIMTAHLSHR